VTVVLLKLAAMKAMPADTLFFLALGAFDMIAVLYAFCAAYACAVYSCAVCFACFRRPRAGTT
jgi:hypothetical protein